MGSKVLDPIDPSVSLSNYYIDYVYRLYHGKLWYMRLFSTQLPCILDLIIQISNLRKSLWHLVNLLLHLA